MSFQAFSDLKNRILYEDNHIIVVNKLPGEIVQADKTGDRTLMDDVKDFIKQRDNKPGNVFLGLPHRLDRPTSGIVILAKTSKALERLSEMFRDGSVDKYYWAVVDKPMPHESGRLTHWIRRNEKENKSYAYTDEKQNTKKAELDYRILAKSEKYYLYEIKLLTGRHHQIRAQFAACNVHIKGDLKYGFPRSNQDGGICLHSHEVCLLHPVSKKEIKVIADPPEERIWQLFD